MSAREFCVYDETRETLLTPRVTVIDTRSDPLRTVKVLIEGLAPNANAGLWLNPLKSVPAVPRLSSYDLVYLDREGSVVHGVELAPDDEVPRIEGATISALLLPLHTFSASHLQPGDRVVLRPAGEVQAPPPSPAASVLAKLPPLEWSTVPEAAHLPVEVPQPVRATNPLAFLRSIAHLRIRVQISITTAPAPNPAPARPVPSPLRAITPAQTPSLQSRFTLLRTAAHDNLRPAFVRGASFLRRQTLSLRRAYLRWAEAFVFARAHSTPAFRPPWIKRYVFDFIFPH